MTWIVRISQVNEDGIWEKRFDNPAATGRSVADVVEQALDDAGLFHADHGAFLITVTAGR